MLTQLEYITAYLDKLPPGAESQGNVMKIRLIRKSELFLIPQIRNLAVQMLKILKDIKVSTYKSDTGSAGSSLDVLDLAVGAMTWTCSLCFMSKLLAIVPSWSVFFSGAMG